uniref:Uncharacterized protein n=1 Tax=Lotus japonicus TaxID=34305 RepID=I3SUT8_LOTJA|nr:unknown [Lotus japonicus]
MSVIWFPQVYIIRNGIGIFIMGLTLDTECKEKGATTKAVQSM